MGTCKVKHKMCLSAGVKARLYLIDFKLPAKHGGCHFSLVSDVNPAMPIYNMTSLKIPKGNQNPKELIRLQEHLH
jgi:hypothetical protein